MDSWLALFKRPWNDGLIRDGTSRRPICYDAPKNKKDQLSLALNGDSLEWDSLAANRPDPDDPGGLGAEESGTERTGPTQDYVVAIQRGGRLAEVGRYYDSANDTVTAGCAMHIPVAGWRGGEIEPPATTLLQPRAVGAIMYVR